METFNKAYLLSTYPNMGAQHTGGGCYALSHPLDDGGFLLITDDAQIPDDGATVVTVGRYDKDGNFEDDAIHELPVSKLEAWIDEQLHLANEARLEDLDKHCDTCTCNEEPAARFPIATASRALLIAFCEWNDKNGCFSDDAATAELGAPLTDAELRQIVAAMME